MGLMLCASAWGAELTRVASSFEPDDPFGFFLDIAFERLQEKGRIDREWYDDQAGGLSTVSELRYQLADTRLKFDAHLGVWRGLELHFGLPIVFQQDRSWTFASGTDATNTTLFRTCQTAGGAGCADPGRGTGRLFDVPAAGAQSFRGGLGDVSFGLAWAIFDQKKDDTKPTWVLRLEYFAPTAVKLNPSVATKVDDRGGIGEKLHRTQFSTTLARRIGFAEPYFQVHYTLPVLGTDVYSNCDDPSADRMSRPENCGTGPWTREETGLKPQHKGGFVIGTELYALERPRLHQKLSFDLRSYLTYASQGRVYNEMSDLLGKLLSTSDYVDVGGQLGISGYAAEFIAIKLLASLGYRTDHWLTGETIGKDLPDANGMTNGEIDITTRPQELNPNFDFRTDRPGTRFRITEQFQFRFQLTVSFSF